MSPQDLSRVELSRKLTPSEKWILVGEFYQTARQIHAQTVRYFQPDATEEDIADHWIAMTAGPELAAAVRAHRRQVENDATVSPTIVIDRP